MSSRRNFEFQFSTSEEQDVAVLKRLRNRLTNGQMDKEILWVGIDMTKIIGTTKNGKSYVIANSGYFKRLWEIDETGYFTNDRPEKINIQVYLPKKKKEIL